MPEKVLLFFFMLYTFLPEYFALEISPKFPLLTASRILFLFCLLLYVWKTDSYGNKFRIRFYRIPDKSVAYAVFFFFFTQIIAILMGSQGVGVMIKALFQVMVEQCLLVYLVLGSVTSAKKFDVCIKAFINGMMVVILIGVIQSITGVNFASFLNTVNRSMLDSSFIRLGYTRASSTLGHSVYFGAMCVLIMPFILALYENTNKKIYLYKFLWCIAGVIASGSRGAILIFCFYLFIEIVTKNRKQLNRYVIPILMSLALISVLLVVLPNVREYLTDIIGTVINLFTQSVSYGQTDLNTTNILSGRFWQFSGVGWILKHYPLCGIGYNAIDLGILYKWLGKWKTFHTIDVGYVGWFVRTGIVGALGQVSLAFGLIIYAYKNKKRTDNRMNRAFFLFIILYYIFLLSIDELASQFWIVIALYFAYMKLNFQNEKNAQ